MSDNKWFTVTENTKMINGTELKQIKYIMAVGSKKPGDLGGWIECEDNLSQEHPIDIDSNSHIYGNTLLDFTGRISDSDIFNSRRERLRDLKSSISIKNSKIYNVKLIFFDASIKVEDSTIGSIDSEPILILNKGGAIGISGSVVSTTNGFSILCGQESTMILVKSVFSLDRAKEGFGFEIDPANLSATDNSVLKIYKSSLKGCVHICADQSSFIKAQNLNVSGNCFFYASIDSSIYFNKTQLFSKNININSRINSTLNIDNSNLFDSVKISIETREINITSSTIKNYVSIVSKHSKLDTDISECTIKDSACIKECFLKNCVVSGSSKLFNCYLGDSMISGDSAVGYFVDGKECADMTFVFSNIDSSCKNDFLLFKDSFSPDRKYFLICNVNDVKGQRLWVGIILNGGHCVETNLKQIKEYFASAKVLANVKETEEYKKYILCHFDSFAESTFSEIKKSYTFNVNEKIIMSYVFLKWMSLLQLLLQNEDPEYTSSFFKRVCKECFNIDISGKNMVFEKVPTIDLLYLNNLATPKD